MSDLIFNFGSNIFNSFSDNAKIVEGAIDFGVKIMQVLKKDSRYDVEAYSFVMTALQYTLKELDEHRHISGKELLYGIRKYAIKQYGPMARTVLEYWGIKETMDFGEIVFNLIEIGLLRKRPEDTKEEFRGVYDFKNAFDNPYRRSFSPKIQIKNINKE